MFGLEKFSTCFTEVSKTRGYFFPLKQFPCIKLNE